MDPFRLNISTILLFLLYPCIAFTQLSKKAEIKNLNIECINDEVFIKYDIVGKTNEKFHITIKFYNQKGTLLDAKSITGDVDTLVNAGTNKKIIWFIKKDYPDFKDNVWAEIDAVNIQHVDMAKSMLNATIFPGLGSYKLTGAKTYLLNGILVYGCIITSFVYEKKAKNKYTGYKAEYRIDERLELFNKAQSYRKTSNTLLYSGLGLMALNYGITFLNFKRSQKKYKNLLNPGLSFNYSDYGTPILTCKINF